MKRISIIVLVVFACTCASGCQHARSFLQMDSNSSVPFLGLQLSVDAGDAQQQSGGLDRNVNTMTLRAKDAELQAASLSPTGSHDAFVKTSSRSPQDATVKLSLPLVDVTSEPQVQADVENILSRWHAAQ